MGGATNLDSSGRSNRVDIARLTNPLLPSFIVQAQQLTYATSYPYYGTAGSRSLQWPVVASGYRRAPLAISVVSPSVTAGGVHNELQVYANGLSSPPENRANVLSVARGEALPVAMTLSDA